MSEYGVFDGKAAEKWFAQVSANIKSASDRHAKFVNALSPVIYADVIDHFEKEKGSERKWKAWSDLYAERMVKKGKGGNKILQDTGRLRNAFKPSNWRTGKDEITWYNNAMTKGGFPYAAAHNEGGKVLPKRDFMWLSDKALQRVASISAAYMLKGSG